MITEEKLNNLNKLDHEDLKLILYKCIDLLGIHDIKDCENIFNVKRSRVYQYMNPYNTLIIGKHKFLMTNIIIKKA